MSFTFAAIDLGITQEEKTLMLSEIKAISDKLWYYDDFRGCYMLPIFNGGGIRNNTSSGSLDFTVAAKLSPTVTDVLKNKIFPFMNPRGRVTVLRTLPGNKLNVHLDSTVEEIGTLQHKFRVVLNGEIDKLYFIDKFENKVYMPRCYDTYILDGSHPHALDPSEEEKITLCVGAPWNGQPTEKYETLLNNSIYTCTVSRPEIKKEWTK
jgi:hypothetical protein